MFIFYFIPKPLPALLPITPDVSCSLRVTQGSQGRMVLYFSPKEVAGAQCGDAVVDASAGEQCDDGNRLEGDGCSAAQGEAGAIQSTNL